MCPCGPQGEKVRRPGRSEAAAGVAGELWAVHGGGFYRSRKYRLAPERLPPTLHWFYWEAYTTWLSGFALLCLTFGSGALVVPSGYTMT